MSGATPGQITICRRAVIVCIRHDWGVQTRTQSDTGMWAVNVLCAAIWDIWRRIVIPVRAAQARLDLAPHANNDTPDPTDARSCSIGMWILNLAR